MKLTNAAITVLINRDGTKIQLHDRDANVTFATITLTPEQLSAALSRQSYVDCVAELQGIDKVGKKHTNESFAFEIPEAVYEKRDKKDLEFWCKAALSTAGKFDWVPDNYYGSQGSFYKQGDKCFAKAIIRKWE